MSLPGTHRAMANQMNFNGSTECDRLRKAFGRVVRCFKIEKAIVVGHSLGALQGSAFAALCPERVKHLVVANLAQGYQRHDEQTQIQVFEKDQNVERTRC